MGEPGKSAVNGADPAVAALLRNRIRFGPEVVTQTVLALVRDGYLRIVAGPGAPVSVIEFAPAQMRALSAWERLVLERLRTRALSALPTPLSVLTTDDGDDFRAWRERLDTDLLAAAEDDGLIRRRLGPTVTLALVTALSALAATAVGIVVSLILRPSPGFAAALGTAFFGFIALLLTVGRLSDFRLSERGRRLVQAADEAAAQASPDSPESTVRSGIAPLAGDHVWSSYGGAWRSVGLGSRFGDTKRIPEQVLATMPERRTGPCQVVKRWYVPGGRELDPAYCLAFDDGSSSFTWTFAVSPKEYAALAVGDLVLLDYSPRRHRLYELEPFTHGGGSGSQGGRGGGLGSPSGGSGGAGGPVAR